MNKSLHTRLWGAALAACMAAAPVGAQKAPTAFRIGGVVALSGTYGIYGVDMQRGVELAIEMRGGTVLGKPIQVIWEDSETKPQPALQKATRLIASGVDMIFGAVNSAATLAIMNLARQRKIPQLVTMSADNKITEPGASRYTFRTSNNGIVETAMAVHFTKMRGLQRVYGVVPDTNVSRDGWAAYRRAAEKAGVQIVGESFPPLGNRDYATIVDAIVRSDADAVNMVSAGSDTATFLRQAAGVNLSQSRVIFGGAIDEAVAGAAGAGALGAYTALRSHHSVDNAANRAFVAAYREKYGEYPSSAAGEAFDGMRWWLDVVDQTGVWDKEAWVDAFEASVNEHSISGRKAMRACDHQAALPGIWGVVVEGQAPLPPYTLRVAEIFPPETLLEPCP